MLEIEIVYGTAEKQILRSIRIEQGATARTAVRQSGLDKDFPELDLNAAPKWLKKSITAITVMDVLSSLPSMRKSAESSNWKNADFRGL